MQTVSNSSTSKNSEALDEIFQEFLRIPKGTATDAMTMEDVESWDSLKHMELIVAIEERFGFQLTFDEIGTMQSLGAIRDLVNTKSAA